MFSILDTLKMGAGIAAGLMLYHLYAVSIGYWRLSLSAPSGRKILGRHRSDVNSGAGPGERGEHASPRYVL